MPDFWSHAAVRVTGRPVLCSWQRCHARRVRAPGFRLVTMTGASGCSGSAARPRTRWSALMA